MRISLVSGAFGERFAVSMAFTLDGSRISDRESLAGLSSSGFKAGVRGNNHLTNVAYTSAQSGVTADAEATRVRGMQPQFNEAT